MHVKAKNVSKTWRVINYTLFQKRVLQKEIFNEVFQVLFQMLTGLLRFHQWSFLSRNIACSVLISFCVRFFFCKRLSRYKEIKISTKNLLVRFDQQAVED